MFGTSGIRGPIGSEVTADLALQVGRAVGDIAVDGDFAGTGRIVVGRDPRESGRLLVDALAAGAREVGADVVDLGVAATPTVARAVEWQDADAGVAVTASHNPPEDNGIKLWQRSGQAFDSDLRERVVGRLDADPNLCPWNRLGEREDDDATDRHARMLAAAVDIEDPPHVIVDLGNGAGGVTIDALGQLGCRVETVNAQPDGSFPGRPSEPTAENCESLATLVGGSDADLGIAHDGDADRTRAVAADGTYLSGDATLALLAAATADRGDRVAVPVDTSLAVADHLAERGIETEYTPVGDVHVAAACADGAAFGGEPSGAWVFPAETLCPDGPLAAVKLVAMAASEPLAVRLADYEPYPIRRDALECADKTAVMDRIRTRIRERYDDDRVRTLDGVRVEADSGWFLLRASGTQPLVRVTAEARDATDATKLFEEARALVEEARDPGQN